MANHQHRSAIYNIMVFGLYKLICFLLVSLSTGLSLLGLNNRFNRKDAKKKECMNTYLTNVLIVALGGLLCWAVGWQVFLLIHGSIFMLAGSAGIWLFYVQHTFEDSYFEGNQDWEYVKAA